MIKVNGQYITPQEAYEMLIKQINGLPGTIIIEL